MSDQLQSQLESILFASARPLSIAQLQKITGQAKKEITETLNELGRTYTVAKKHGVIMQHVNDTYQLVTHPDHAEIVASFVQSDITGELTEPALETLTIIAYRGPMTKPEIEQIRGINCSLILRNLLIRGLIEKKENTVIKLPQYSVTHDFIRFLGINTISELPEYETLSNNETLEQVAQDKQEGE